MGCIICNNSTKVLFTQLPDRLHPEIPGKYTLKQCLNCRLIFVEPQPSAEELKAHYPEYYHVYQRRTHSRSAKKSLTIIVAREYFGYGKPRRYLRICLLPLYFKLSHLPHWVNKGKLLDVGCGVGDRMLIFKELGWNVEGLEMDPKAGSVARDKTGCKIHISSLEEADLPNGHFDVVYLNNVFEHLRKPRQALCKIKKTLRTNGELVVVVPSGDSFAFKLFKQHWFALEVPRHLFTYNKANISMLLHQCGFSVKTINYANTLGSIASSMAYRLGKPVDTFSFSEKPLWALNLFIDPIFNMFGIGDWMIVHARVKKGELRY